jgi:16S rRNA C967 or C1407 C5-methylase (RsmB/RsmF family)
MQIEYWMRENMISDIDKKWIIRRLKETEPYESYNKGREGKNKEESYIDYINWLYERLAYKIKKDAPSDIQGYVENELKKREYSRRISSIAYDPMLDLKNPKNEKVVEQREKELKEILKEIDKKHPEFRHDLRFEINLAQDTIASKKAGYEIRFRIM